MRAILFPIIKYQSILKQGGLDIKIFEHIQDDVFDCDILIVESRFHGLRWKEETDKILGEMEDYKNKSEVLCYYDTSDSSYLLHPEVLPVVDYYLKGQLLSDRNKYKQPMYGNRIFTDYCYREFAVEDQDPAWSIPVQSDTELEKIKLAWNSSLADYSMSGKYLMHLYSKLPYSFFLQYPQKAHAPSNLRHNDVSCRMGTNYYRKTVAWYREKAKQALSQWVPTERISYREYFKELQNSKIVVSPFGWGEINYKDYETFLSGALLVKPDMSHMETWPDLYQKELTYIPYSWDSKNLKNQINQVVDNYEKYDEIALNGQEQYLLHLSKDTAPDIFFERLTQIISELI